MLCPICGCGTMETTMPDGPGWYCPGCRSAGLCTFEATTRTATVVGIEWNLCGKCKVQCDICRNVYTTQTWKFPRLEERAKLADELREAGWQVNGDHEGHICPDCVLVTRTPLGG